MMLVKHPLVADHASCFSVCLPVSMNSDNKDAHLQSVLPAHLVSPVRLTLNNSDRFAFWNIAAGFVDLLSDQLSVLPVAITAAEQDHTGVSWRRSQLVHVHHSNRGGMTDA